MHKISSIEMAKVTVLACALINSIQLRETIKSIIFCLLFVLKASHYPILEQLNTADID